MPELQVIETKELYDTNVAYNNLVEASKITDYRLSMSAVYGWLMCNPNTTLYDIEIMLRKDNIPIYLIAEESNNSNQQLVLPRNNIIDLKYTCAIVVNTQNKIDEYMKTNDINYEKNLKKLEICGFEFSDEINTNDIHELKNRDDINDIQDIVTQLQHIGVSINVSSNDDPQSMLDKDIDIATKKYGNVEQTIINSDNKYNYIQFFVKINDNSVRISDWILKISKEGDYMEVVSHETAKIDITTV
jgi:hypothetical protein